MKIPKASLPVLILLNIWWNTVWSKTVKPYLQKYLGDGCRCYVPREKIDPFEAIRLIRLAGGVAFFAHPVLCHMNFDRLKAFIQELKEHGLTGIEAVYSANSPGDERNFRRIAKRIRSIDQRWF